MNLQPTPYESVAPPLSYVRLVWWDGIGYPVSADPMYSAPEVQTIAGASPALPPLKGSVLDLHYMALASALYRASLKRSTLAYVSGPQAGFEPAPLSRKVFLPT